jgi:hypothetical protein
MRAAVFISASAVLTIALSVPAIADCLEDVEAFELAALQNGLPVDGDPALTPTARGRTAYSKNLQAYLLEAETAAKAGNEPQCEAVFADALEIAKNE